MRHRLVIVFQLPLQCKWDLRYSWTLHVDW